MTNTRPIRVLLVEDNPGDVRLASEMLKVPGQARYEQIVHERLSAALEYLDRHSVDVVLLDLSLPDSQGLETLTRMQRANPELPIVILSGLADEQVALSAVQLGAQDYIVKGHKHGDIMARSIRYAIERKRGHLSLIEALEKAELASRSKSEFLANMSHELRTPLNAIIGFSEMMEQQILGELSDKYRDYAGSIRSSGAHLLDIINDILDIARIEAGDTELIEETFTLLSAIESSVRLIEERASTKNIKVSVDAAPDLPQLFADARNIKQVLINLLANAVKFTDDDGKVSISARMTGSGLAIAVSDNGIGMRASDIPAALAPFGQADSALERKFEGTGLGLPLSKTLVELHGGTLWIDSALGRGTTVTITLPEERLVRAKDAALQSSGSGAA